MVCKVEYGPKYFIIFELIDTPAVRKWVYAVNENKIYDYFLYGRPLNSYYVNQYKDDVEEKTRLVELINYHIDELNKTIAGEQFPFKAHVNMNFTESQLIHRSFTTAASTHGSWVHNIPDDLLRSMKFVDSDEKHRLMKKYAKQQFTIKDFDKFDYHAEMVNWQIHNFEPFIKSDRAIELEDLKCSTDCIYHQFDNKSETGDIAKEKFTVGVNLTVDELSKSFIGNYLEYDVFMHSSIFGKSYLETYVEYDNAGEFDVVNVENIIGDFFIVPEHPRRRKRFFNDSPWSKWIGELLLPMYLTHPVPLGKIVDRIYPDVPAELAKLKSTNISFRWN